MKKLLGLALYGLALFGVTAGVGLKLRSLSAPATTDVAPEAETQPAADPQRHEIQPQRLTVDHQGAIRHEPPVKEAAREDTTLPVAIRPEEMSVEQIVRLGLGLKERDEAIRQREAALQRTESQYLLLVADMQGEKKELEGLQIQARDQRVAAEQLLQQITTRKQELEQTRIQLEAQKKEIEAARVQLERDRTKASEAGSAAPTPADAAAAASDPAAILQANIKTVSPIMASMTPEKAAEQLQEMVNNGNMPLAVGVVEAMDERKAGVVLDTITDKQLVNTILEQLGRNKVAAKPTRKR